MYLFIVISILV